MAEGHQDKIAVVTGAASGIGQAFAQRLAEDGAHIVIADVQRADDTISVEKAGRRRCSVKCDCRIRGVRRGACRGWCEKRFGRGDILINCAGIFKLQPFEEMSFADWRRTLSINLDSAFLPARLSRRA